MRLRNAGSKEGKEEPRLDSDGGRSSKTLCRLHPPHFSNFIENKDTANLHLSATQPDSVWVYLYSFAAAPSLSIQILQSGKVLCSFSSPQLPASRDAGKSQCGHPEVLGARNSFQ